MVSSILLLALVFSGAASTIRGNNEWDYVQIIKLAASELGKCQSLCEANERCWEWELQRSPTGSLQSNSKDETDNSSQSHNVTQPIYVDCFLQSREFVLIKKSLPSSVISPRSQPRIAGHKRPSTADPATRAQTQALVAGPVAIDTSTLLNFPQHFVSQCAYTLSLWVWIWRPGGADRSERVVLSTKEVHPRLTVHPAILPAIVYNVGDKPDRFFFAAAQGQALHDYLGFHRGQVRYHQWVHLALTMEGNVMRVFQDGEYLDSLHYAPSEILPTDRCAYDSDMDVSVNTAAAAPAPSATLQRRSTGAAFFDAIMTDPFAAHVNNTVLYVGGKAHGRGQHSTVGMVHQLVVVRNLAYSAAQVAELAERTRPAVSPALQKLLKAHGIACMDGICPAPAPTSFYEALDWGLCPQEVCGHQCLDEKVFLDAERRDGRKPTETGNLRAQAVRGLVPSSTDGTRRTRSGTKTGLPAIGRPLGADGIYEGGGDFATGFDPLELVLGSSVLQVLLPVLANLHLGWLALLLGLQSTAPDVAAPPKAAATTSPVPASKITPSKRRKGTRNTRETQAQELYDTAMARSEILPAVSNRASGDVNARSEESSGILDAARSVVAEDFTTWRAKADEEARAALMMGMWLADDASVGKRDPRDQPWNFKEAPLLAQPMHLSLGYRAGYGAVSENYVPFEEVDALLSTTNDSFLIPLMEGPLITESSASSGDTPPFDREEGSGQFYIDGPPAAVGQGASLTDENRRDLRDKYEFTLNERGEVTISEATSVAHGGDAAKTAKTSASGLGKLRSTDWLRVFSNLTTDSIKASLHTELAELVQAGLNASFVHNLILDRQRGRLGTEQAGEKEQSRDDKVQGGLTALVAPSHLSSAVKAATGAADCAAAAAYYFPVTQYVAAQFGASHSGTGPLEEVRLIVSGGTPEGHGGEEDELHQHTEAEAHDGNPDAQTWLAKKYFWGLGGVARNEFAARRWFERAAAQNDPEGLYNVGIFHNNGQAGLPQNEELAMQYFHRAADHPHNPFPLAMNVVGNYYLHSAEKQNYTKAMDYFLKAAARHSDDAHFSLAMIYREGLGCAKDVPRSVAHLAVAASWGHVRALNFLAHALHDGDSWLAQYGREQHALRRHRAMLSVLLSTPTHDGEMHAGAGGAAASSSSNATAAADALLRNSLVFDEFELIKIYLSNGQVVPMPYPLGNPAGSCEAALPLLKHIAEMSYRPKDVTSQALKHYIKGDYWGALSLYEEAADLGVWAAQENAAYLIEKIGPAECAQMAEDLADNENQPFDLTIPGTGGDDGHASTGCATAAECCVRYLERRAAHRWAQLSSVGEPRAMRKMAGALQGFLSKPVSARTEPNVLNSELALGEAALPLQQQPAVLYALAGEQGDTESMLNLGWMLYYGSNGVKQNVTAAIALFTTAMELEADVGDEEALAAAQEAVPLANLTARELAAEQENALRRHQHTRRWHPAGFASRSTAGAAPALALAVTRLDAFLRSVGINATVLDMQLEARRTAAQRLPSWAVDWAFRTGRSPAASARKEKSWWSSLRLEWTRAARRCALWLGRMEEMHLELYSATWETILLIVIVALSRLVLMRRFRR